MLQGKADTFGAEDCKSRLLKSPWDSIWSYYRVVLAQGTRLHEIIKSARAQEVLKQEGFHFYFMYQLEAKSLSALAHL